MTVRNHLSIWAALAALLSFAATPSIGQPLTGAPGSPEFKFSTPMPPGIATPDNIDTRLGTRHFFDGFPDKATVEKVYDNLDFQRASRRTEGWARFISDP